MAKKCCKLRQHCYKPCYVYHFLRKMILMLYSIIRPNFTVSLSLFLEILDNMCTAIVCFPHCDVINFEINLIFLTKQFSTWTKTPDKNLNIMTTKRAFKLKWKNFQYFWRALSCQKFSHTWWDVFTLNFKQIYLCTRVNQKKIKSSWK